MPEARITRPPEVELTPHSTSLEHFCLRTQPYQSKRESCSRFSEQRLTDQERTALRKRAFGLKV
jgi:hypothetical protein